MVQMIKEIKYSKIGCGLPTTLYAIHLLQMFPDVKFNNTVEVCSKVKEKGFSPLSEKQADYLHKRFDPIVGAEDIRIISKVTDKTDVTCILVVGTDHENRYTQEWSNKAFSTYKDPGVFIFTKD